MYICITFHEAIVIDAIFTILLFIDLLEKDESFNKSALNVTVNSKNNISKENYKN